ncbi:rhomboid family [Seminavis robusta]|uniref:Rhomboid family n=1 Tax=Seminavis robusta TaxID=568900 RepID=A0A9N8E181_9STRA|nr:rhomboid family [Seminavis robusta]|eukprot:Sro548_g164410.1 rhomboid family (365) ;mRNA; f:30726-31820
MNRRNLQKPRARVASMRTTILCWILCVSVVSADQHRYRSPHPLLVQVRGGDSNNNNEPYELNPNWQNYPSVTTTARYSPQEDSGGYYYPSSGSSSQQPTPTLLQDIDDTYHPSTASSASSFSSSQALLQLPQLNNLFKYDGSSFQAIVEKLKRQLRTLQKAHPDLFAVSTASIVVFVMWQLPPFHDLLQTHFVCRKRLLQAGRLHVLWLSGISHVSLLGLMFNVYSLWSLGPAVKEILQPSKRFLLWPFLLGAAGTASLIHAVASSRDGSLGLAPVNAALLAVLARRYPHREIRMRLFGIVPIQLSGHLLLRILLIWSALGSLVSSSGNTAHVAHMAGLLFGMAYFELWQRRRQQQQQQRRPFF